ncbi:hypothetical protein C8F01DRAFT_1346526 [Mycena amicta]|nr:hypothetical protein C8F01DRAFT_1346526 [Mycena amicta]
MVPSALSLQFQNITRIAGETLKGLVHVNVQLAKEDHIERVKVKFRGSIHTSITRSGGPTVTTDEQTVVLFHKTFLWTQGSTYSESCSNILSVPFEFTLPSDLPPSFHYADSSCHATIGYSLEVVGERSGLFRSDRCIRRAISVLPAATPAQLVAKELLLQGSNLPCRTYAREEKLRRGFWHDHACVRATVTIPDLPSFPISTPIPFSFYIETDTRPMKREDCPDGLDKHGKPIFPAPPTLSSEVKLNLHRSAQLRGKKNVREVENTYKVRKSVGDAASVDAVVHTESAPEWIPAPGGKNKGRWRRSIKFESSVRLNHAPTYQGENLEWNYRLCFIAPFSGMGNDLKISIPIRLNACAPCPPPPTTGVAGASAAGLPHMQRYTAAPPPMLDDLPPEYWVGEHHGWDRDEKKW